MESALRIISDDYLEDDPAAYRWNGYFALRDGELTRFYITQGTSAPLLREDIARIDVVSERGLLERDTFARPADD